MQNLDPPWEKRRRAGRDCRRASHAESAAFLDAFDSWRYQGVPIAFTIVSGYGVMWRQHRGLLEKTAPVRTLRSAAAVAAGWLGRLRPRLPFPAPVQKQRPRFLLFSDDYAPKGMLPLLLLAEELSKCGEVILGCNDGRRVSVPAIGTIELASMDSLAGLPCGTFRPTAPIVDRSGLTPFPWPALAAFVRKRELLPVSAAAFGPWLLHHGQGAVLLHELARRALSRLRPDAVYVNKDYDFLGTCVCAAARELGIPSYTMLHGLQPADCSCQPLVADKVFCWGPESRDWYLAIGSPAERVLVSGNPAFDQMLRQGRDAERQGATRRQLGVPKGHRILLVGTTPISSEENRALLDGCLAAVAGIEGLTVVLKPHPAESPQRYAEEPLVTQGGALLLRPDQLSAQDAINVSDAVAVYNSTLGLEALIAGKRLFVLDWLPKKTMISYAKAIPALCYNSPAELGAGLRGLVAGLPLADELALAVSRYLDAVTPSDGQAAVRMAAWMSGTTENP